MVCKFKPYLKGSKWRCNKLLMLMTGVLTYLPFSIGCKKLITLDAPVTSINTGNVYSTAPTAIAVLTGIYSKMSGSFSGYFSFSTGSNSIALTAGLSADELTLYSGISNASYIGFYKNALTANPTASIGADYWVDLYNCIFLCDSALEGLNKAAALPSAVRQQLLGEARFLRAFCYFYLVNLYGDVPLVTTTDYQVNAALPRTSSNAVYEQMITDLIDAQNLLSADYLNGDIQPYPPASVQRLRPTKWAASALLARVYLYKGDYANAEAQASTIIEQAWLFQLEDLDNVFLQNSREAIWQLQPVNAGRNTEDAFAFIIPSTGPSDAYGGVPAYLSPYLLQAFEANDQRKNNWVGQVTVDADTYSYPYKYKLTVEMPVNEYLMVLRLAELYLIRAEARARQGNLSGAADDLNAVRKRAGLDNTSADTQTALLSAILHEKQVELFSEWGHRWLDLKRTGKVNEVMTMVTPQKGGTWNANWQWYPLPFSDLQKNSRLQQNPGY